MEGCLRFVVALVVFVLGTVVTAIVLSMAGYQPDSFYDVFVPWLMIAFFLLFLPSIVGMALLSLCALGMAGAVVMTFFGVGMNIIDYFQQEPERACSYDCPQQIPDTSDDIDFTTPTGDNNHSPGTHNVDGHYRGGTYVEPYMRSNPDGDTSNNLNP